MMMVLKTMMIATMETTMMAEVRCEEGGVVVMRWRWGSGEGRGGAGVWAGVLGGGGAKGGEEVVYYWLLE